LKHQKGWRRFVPKRRVTLPEFAAGGVLQVVENELRDIRYSMRGKLDASQLDEPIEDLKTRAALLNGPRKTLALEALVVLQTPRAALAQHEMDSHEHNYHDRTKRLFELIDFNDSFVDAVLAQPADRLPHFTEHLKHQMLSFCHSLRLPMFTDEQFEAIVHGLSREIAVYLGAIAEGFEAEMTPRAVDAFGIDVIVTNRSTGRSANIDCKTPSAFRHRIGELVREGRVSEDDFYTADEQNYITVMNRRNDQQVPVTIMCIRPEDLGEVVNFRFATTAPLGKLLTTIFASLKG